MSARIALIGAPGSGKSAIAAELARRWQAELIDTDAEYERRTTIPVAEAVVDDEAAFHAAEADIVAQAVDVPGAVIAVGSGALGERVREALAAVPVVWLEVGLVDAVRRSGLSGIRPVALGNIRAQVGEMLEARSPLYAAMSDTSIATDARAVASVADEIEQWEATR